MRKPNHLIQCRRIPAWAVLLCVLLLGATPAPAEEVTLHILHTNDIHQALEPLPRIAGYVSAYKRAHPNTLFLDAGDFLDRGSSMVPLTLGDAMYGAMARMGYDACILGNHDWIYGDQGILALIRKYPIPVLGSNLATTTPPLPPNVVPTLIKEFQGLRVGFFGITLDTYGKNPAQRPGLYVLDCRESTEKAIAALKAANVDLIIAITHLGFQKMAHETNSPHPSDQDLLRAYPQIQAIIGGHSHTLLPEATTRKLFAETGAVVVQAGAQGTHLGRLTLTVDREQRRVTRFEMEQVKITPSIAEDPAVAAFLKEQYDRHLPGAQEIVGEFSERIEFHNLAYWYADFIRRQSGADLVLIPRRSLYDEPTSFGKAVLTRERLFGILGNRYLVRSTVSGAELLRYCAGDEMRNRFHPHHHGLAPFSGDGIFPSGMNATFVPADQSVQFDLDPNKEYTLVTPWPYTHRDIARHKHRLPAREAAAVADPVPGLRVRDSALLPHTTWELLDAAAQTGPLTFSRKYTEPRPDWEPWRLHFEAALTRKR